MTVVTLTNQTPCQKTYGRMEVQLHVFFTSAADGGEWLNLTPAVRATKKRKTFPPAVKKTLISWLSSPYISHHKLKCLNYCIV
jgi:hypothetical protein